MHKPPRTSPDGNTLILIFVPFGPGGSVTAVRVGSGSAAAQHLDDARQDV